MKTEVELVHNVQMIQTSEPVVALWNNKSSKVTSQTGKASGCGRWVGKWVGQEGVASGWGRRVGQEGVASGCGRWV